MPVYIYVYKSIYAYICLPYICLCLSASVYISVYHISVCICLYLSTIYLSIYIYAYVYMCIYMSIYICPSLSLYIYIYTGYIYVHIYIIYNTHKSRPICFSRRGNMILAAPTSPKYMVTCKVSTFQTPTATKHICYLAPTTPTHHLLRRLRHQNVYAPWGLSGRVDVALLEPPSSRASFLFKFVYEHPPGASLFHQFMFPIQFLSKN